MAEHEPPADLLSIREFAALCRERCARVAQGYDDGEVEPRPCGDEFTDDEGRTVHVFCGSHWGPVLAAMTEETHNGD